MGTIRRSKWFLSLALLAAFASASAQDAKQQKTAEKFEVASVRLLPPDVTHESVTTTISPPGANPFIARSMTLRNLVMLAYEINANQVVGMPDWMDSQEYDITAKEEGAKGLDYQELELPMRQLLEERFHLKVHRETRPMDGFELVLAKGGPKFGESKGISGTPIMSRNELRIQNMTTTALVAILGKAVPYPIVDKTGLTGHYDLDVKYAPLNSTNSDLPNIYEALQQQLGLKLEHAKVPANVLVIDHIERVPSAD